jgi:predicted Rossmann fold flavoprotein
MKIAIVGSGASGLYCAILLKKKNAANDVFVIEKDEKIGRKLYATGNGHCNLLNKSLESKAYNHPDFMEKVISLYPYSYLKKELADWGLEVIEEGDYVYPLNFSASSFVGFLTDLCHSLGVHFVLKTCVRDYEIGNGGITLMTSEGSLPSFDKLILAVGGESTPKLGSDGSFFPILKKHGYEIEDLRPGLAPLKLLDEDVKPLAGLRHNAKVEVVVSGKVIFSEKGEVLYKNDGISGIVIFNAESALLRINKFKGAEIHLDLFPDISEKELVDRLAVDQKANPLFFFEAYFQEELAKHILARAKSQTDGRKMAQTIKNLVYSVREPYSFENSQVTIGGVSLKEVDSSLQSKREKNVYFAGEIVDIDGNCGGFNLSWALLSALMIVRES